MREVPLNIFKACVSPNVNRDVAREGANDALNL